uniref:Macaca fascicularis brain cDNA, clone: QflA-15313 n=1 Tax=Macaca fascicularis TaxID=9541 RepID=I7GHT1_MACFA|nr:unnamed protein product [Macaca fascicularis]
MTSVICVYMYIRTCPHTHTIFENKGKLKAAPSLSCILLQRFLSALITSVTI